VKHGLGFHKRVGLNAHSRQVVRESGCEGRAISNGTLNVWRSEGPERCGMAGRTKTGAARTAPPGGAPRAATGVAVSAAAPASIRERIIALRNFQLAHGVSLISANRFGGRLAEEKELRRIFLTIAVALAGCSMRSQAPLPSTQSGDAMRVLSAIGAGKIVHVIYIVQENRSFDDVFQGYPSADTVSRGKNSKGKTIELQPVSLSREYVIDHSAAAMFAACHGTGKLRGTKCRMDGFNKEQHSVNSPPNAAYVYVPHVESKPYFDMAHEWVLADRMFQSQLDESFVAHQYIIAAQAHSSVNIPNGPWGCPGGPSDSVATITRERRLGPSQGVCFDYRTLGDELDKAGRSWRFYTSQYTVPTSGFWSGYQAIKHIYDGPDWKKDVITPQKKFLTDVSAGKLANFTWVTPLCEDSDHVSCGGGYGPSWVAALVNEIGQSKFWSTSVIFVQWDDWGGMYDHVRPPHRGYDSLGFRVPLLVISPYAKRDYVSHVQYETASVLRFAEDLFELGSLAAADRRAASPAKDCFDFSQRARGFVRIKAPKGRNFFLHQANDNRAPDDE
jgi:phospholipase C